MARFYEDTRKPKARPQLKSRCQLKRVLTLSREQAEAREVEQLQRFHESQGDEVPHDRKRRKA